MTYRIQPISIALTSCAALWLSVSFARAEYLVTDLGAISYPFPQVAAINNSGQVAATNETFGGSPIQIHALLYSGSTTTDLGGLGASPSSSASVAINDAGQVVGDSTTAGGESHAFVYSNGTMKDLGTLGGQPNFRYSVATGINAAGAIVGSSTTQRSPAYSGMFNHAFLYANGVMKDLGVLGGLVEDKPATYSSATGINASGQVVGFSGSYDQFLIKTHAFLYSNGVMKDLGVLGQFISHGITFSSSLASAINNAGQVVGVSSTNNGTYHATLFSGGVRKDLGSLGALIEPWGKIDNSMATAINSQGQIVGSSTTSHGNTAFLYQNGHMLDLNTLLTSGSGWQITDASGINDLGQIVVRGTDAHHNIHLLELTPEAAPEPGSLTLGVFGVLALIGYGCRRGRSIAHLVAVAS